ncbi:Beta-tubulin cofactor D family protein [Tritrichomonas foetus]|uniref:Beta-tubulin cofactor D family protein n=1 Tax=Tritrichomonas foetus TaxID=1144522 RepID=A0A1J4JXH4_9EUKA|nr:Beta-tubulin cofactor D family protein [Tritrichomonas foetus]|eukprot:OHT03370.1 Beta-tubulin cofactor D family protein [Tritrichomonas foetus]
MTHHIAAADDLSTVVISEIKDEIINDTPLVNESEILESANEIKSLTKKLCENPSESEAAAKIVVLASNYMEMPQLLDPILAILIGDLTKTCMAHFGDDEFAESLYYCIYHLSNIRGYRELLPLFPNEVQTFEPVSNAFCKGSQRWEVRYVLLLWLSQLSLVPFDINFHAESREKLISDLINKSTELLASPARDSDSAAFFLSRLLLRNDMVSRRDEFLHTAFKSLSPSQERLTTGYLKTIFHMLTSFDKLWAIPYANEMLTAVSSLANSPSAHHRLYHMKVIQQLGLVFLPPRVAPWRYQRGRILKIGEKNEDNKEKVESTTDEVYKNEENYEVPLEVNTILEMLFTGLQSQLSIVRWSAAKGVGRIVERLPYEIATQPVEYAFSLFDDVDNYNLINGACLTFAEFTLRGVFLPSTMIRAMPIILNSLIYDVQLGSHSVAENVRDAGCFICWAIARTYDGAHLQNVCVELAQQLVNVFLFDRCVNVRRSASAAFQEGVGRHGKFPNGLELIHVADFLSVSSRVGCYLKIAPFVAQFPDYGPSMVAHLANNRIQHWDEEIRMLAAQSLSIIAKDHQELITTDVLASICASCESYDIEIKHGGYEALANLLWVMDIDVDILKDHLDLSEECQSDEIKCSFIKMLSAAAKRDVEVPNLSKVLREWLLSDSQAVQRSAIESLIFLGQSEKRYLSEDFFNDLMKEIANPGVAAALSAFPLWYIESHIDNIVSEICRLLSDGGPIIATKTSLLESVKRISKYTTTETVKKILAIGLNDRTTTKRGDEGSAVRTMGLKVLEVMLPNEELANSLVSDVLKLCLDRISGIRDISLNVLRKIVQTTENLKYKDKFSFAATENAGDFKNFASLMSVEEYALVICEKMILCVGAYAPELTQRSGQALIHFMRQEGNTALVGKLLNQLFIKFRCDIPFTNSLFAFIPKILNEGLLRGKVLFEFAQDFLKTCSAFLKKVTFRKYNAIAPTITWLSVLCTGDQRKQAFSLLAPLFVCEYPVVRDNAATNLNEAFDVQSIFDDDSDDDENEEDDDEFVEKVQKILSDTNWKEDFDQCAAGIREMCALFGVDVPVIEKKEAVQEKRVFSYGNLVRDSL